MKHSTTKPPKGTTHVRLTTPEGKHSTVEVKAMTVLDGIVGTLSFFKMVKSKLIPIDPAPHGAPETVLLGFKNQKDESLATVRVMNDNAKARTAAMRALADKFGGGTWSYFEHEPTTKEPTIDLVAIQSRKAQPGPSVAASNIVPLKDRPAVAEPDAATEAAKPAPKKKDEDKRGDKGTFIDNMLTNHKLKLSTILEKVMAAYPEGNQGRTLRRIRKQAIALKKGKNDLAYIDEPDFKAGK